MRKGVFFAMRVAAGALFAVSGYTKLVAPYQDLLASIHAYRLVTGAPALWLALALPWLELFAGVYFVLGLWTRASLAALWGMNAVFVAALASAVVRRLPLESCGCFGEGSPVHLKPHEMLCLDLALTLLFILLWRAPEARFLSLDAFFSKSRQSVRTPRP